MCSAKVKKKLWKIQLFYSLKGQNLSVLDFESPWLQVAGYPTGGPRERRILESRPCLVPSHADSGRGRQKARHKQRLEEHLCPWKAGGGEVVLTFTAPVKLQAEWSCRCDLSFTTEKNRLPPEPRQPLSRYCLESLSFEVIFWEDNWNTPRQRLLHINSLLVRQGILYVPFLHFVLLITFP